MCGLRRGRHRIVVANLPYVTGSDHRVRRSFYTAAGNILVCAGPAAAVTVRTVRCPVVTRTRFKQLCSALTVLQTLVFMHVCGPRRGRQVRTSTRCNQFASVIQNAVVHRRIVLHVRRCSSTSSNHTRNIHCLFIFSN